MFTDQQIDAIADAIRHTNARYDTALNAGDAHEQAGRTGAAEESHQVAVERQLEASGMWTVVDLLGIRAQVEDRLYPRQQTA